ncbi:extracellular solute-binding protein [Egicoccus sp. AB-alg6-2]|uniref:sugar ABC transporter substrate-binding protein n=1 Tax=Egicoccus sp. AB-alg6-2 TaxID=3242692 RepID=UPI00359D33CD
MRAAFIGGALALLVAGCSAAATPPEPALVRVIMADDWASAPAVREVFDQFERDHGNVQVQVQAVPFSQIPELVASSQELDQPYDLAHWHAFAAAATGLAEPVDEQWEQAGLTYDEFLPGAIEDVMWLGRPYGVPLDTNALVLLADAGVLRQAGIEPADLATLDGFVAAAEAVATTGAAKWMMPVSTSSWQTYGWIRAFGGELVRVDPGTGVPAFTFDRPETVAALEFLVACIHEGYAPRPYGPDLAADSVQAFATGEVATHATGSWDLNVVARDPSREVEVTVLPLPQADPGRPLTVLGGSSLFVPRGAHQPDLAFDLMLRLIEDDVALRLAEEEGRLPARTRVFDAPLFADDPLLSAFVEQLPNARVMPLIAYPEVAQAFTEALNSALTGRETPAEAMAGLQRYAETWLASQPDP